MVPVPGAAGSPAPTALPSVTPSVSPASSMVSPATWTTTAVEVVPAGNVNVPDAAT
jgi:hypothetical protein